MDDIIERLRTIIATPHGVDIWTTTALEAADEIERLREALAEYKFRLHWANEELLKRGRS